jgi:hypothetical protein
MEESARMRERACETDFHHDGLVGSEADAEPDGEAGPAPAGVGDGGMAGGGEAEMRSV